MSRDPIHAGLAPNVGGGPVAGSTWGPVVFVYSVWAVMLAAGLGLVGRYGSAVPYVDDWVYVPLMTGEQPVTLDWLWQQHNEHRITLQKVILLPLLHLTGFDFRAGMVFTVLSLGAVALLLIRVARQVRGETDYTDAVFPLALLHWGHAANLLFGFQVQHSSSMLLLGTLLAIIVTRGMKPGLGAGVLAGICLLWLPLSGAQGLAFVPALALWLGASALLRATPWRSSGRRAKTEACLLGSLAAGALVLVLCYFLGLEQVHGHGPRPSIAAALKTAVALLALSFGPGYPSFWPYCGIAATALLAGGVVLLGAAVWRQPAPERFRALGLLFYLGGSISLALGFGWGRATLNEDLTGLSHTYILLAVPALVCLYYAWVLYSPRAVRSLVPMCLLSTLTAVTALDVPFGLGYAQYIAEGMEAFEKDLRAGRPVYYLVARHKEALLTGMWDPKDLADLMRQLRRAEIGLFQHLQDDPPLHEVPISVATAAVNQISWKAKTGHGSGADSHLTFALPDSLFLAGVSIRFKHSNHANAHFRVAWRQAGTDDFPASPQHLRLLELGPGEQTATVYIADTIDQLRIYPDNKPFEFRLVEITLLMPESGMAQ